MIYIKKPFANIGDKTPIPFDAVPSGEVSFEQGYTADYQADQTSDPNAKDIERAKFNWFWGVMSENIKHWQENTYPVWFNDIKYPKNATVKYTDGNIYVSKVDNNTALPTDTGKWDLYGASFVKTTGNQTINGIKTFSSSPIVPIPTKDFQSVPLKSTNITVNVGAGQTYTTINQALEYLSGFYPMYKNSGITATINLKAGFVVQESVNVFGLNLGWIIIISESPAVMIDHTKVTDEYIFTGGNGATLPIIKFQMDFITRKTNGKGGIQLLNNSTGIVMENCGVIGAGLNGALVNSSALVCISSIFSQSGGNGILAQGSSRVQANSATVNNCDGSGILGQTASTIQFQGGKVENQMSANPRIKVSGGAVVNAREVSTTGGTSTVYSQVINTLTSNGIIFG